MEFKIVDTSSSNDTITADGTAEGSMGGTELMRQTLQERIPELMEQVDIVSSRVREINPDKKTLLWLHDLWNDPESAHLRDEESRKRFEKIIFVSNWQQFGYNFALGVPYGESLMLRNAINPALNNTKSKDGPLKLIYHTTPHRGLELLVPAFDVLYQKHGDKIHLDVYSSFRIYGWASRDIEYADLFAKCKEHPGITYHGFQPHAVVLEALQDAHIFAYPSIWPETSCIAAMEAMSAGCAIVCPNLGALPETTGGLATMYQFNEDTSKHATMFASVLNFVIENYWHEQHTEKLRYIKNYADNMYNWDVREDEWRGLLHSL